MTLFNLSIVHRKKLDKKFIDYSQNELSVQLIDLLEDIQGIIEVTSIELIDADDTTAQKDVADYAWKLSLNTDKISTRDLIAKLPESITIKKIGGKN